MIETLAISRYRSLHDLVLPMSPLTLITGANGSGKSNLYNALRLLSEVAGGNVVGALAKQGGLPSTLWAGPAKISRAMQLGEVPVQGTPSQEVVRLKLGFSTETFGYLLELGLPESALTAFHLDPIIKRECLWNGPAWRQASMTVERKNALLKRRDNRRWQIVTQELSPHDSLFSHAGDPASVPEVFAMRNAIRGWRFYSDFRTDSQAPARQSGIATRTPVLHHDGGDLAAALQTIIEIGDHDALMSAIDDAFPGSTLEIKDRGAARLSPGLIQPGLLRALDCTEWSDGTLRYLLLVCALLTPRPPSLMVLNEPETSLHPDLLPALARLIANAATRSQIWVVSHAPRLVAALESESDCSTIVLEKSLGRSRMLGLRDLDTPPWRWAK